MRSVERSQSELRAELTEQHSKTLEEQKKREAQDALVRRLQKRVLLLTKVPGDQPRTLKHREVFMPSNMTFQTSPNAVI